MLYNSNQPMDLEDLLYRTIFEVSVPPFMEDEIKKVYVCAPFCTDDLERDKQSIIEYCQYVVDKGYIPLNSFLFLSQFLNYTERDDEWVAMTCGKELIKDADQMWVFDLIHCTDEMKEELQVWIETGKPLKIMD